jgi:hypothetical protein
MLGIAFGFKMSRVIVISTINRYMCYVLFLDDNFSFLGPTLLKLHTLVAYGRGMLGIVFGFKRLKVKVTVTIHKYVCYIFVSGR